MKRIIYSENAPEPIGPYSQAVQINDLIFVSGQIPIDPVTGKLIRGNISEKTDRIFRNIRSILGEIGLSLNNIVKIEIFMRDITLFTEVNKVYADVFKKSDVLPARSVVGVISLPKNADIEISCIADGSSLFCHGEV